MLYLLSEDSLSFSTCLAVISRLHVLATQFPAALTQEVFAAIEDGRKRLLKSINTNKLDFPARQDLVLFYTIGQIYETSDLSHTIVNATTLFMGQILSQMRVRSVQELARGLFVCSIFLQVLISLCMRN
jgi:nucleolar protein 14